MKCSTCQFYWPLPFGDNHCSKLMMDNFHTTDDCDLGLKAAAVPIFKQRLMAEGYLKIMLSDITNDDLACEIRGYFWRPTKEEKRILDNEPLSLGFMEKGVEIEIQDELICILPWHTLTPDSIWWLRRRI